METTLCASDKFLNLYFSAKDDIVGLLLLPGGQNGGEQDLFLFFYL